MTYTETQPYIPTDEDRSTWEQLMLDRAAAVLEDEEVRNEWARR